MADNLQPPYPEVFPIVAAQTVVDYLRGSGGHDYKCLVHAGWVLFGYAAGQIIPDEHPLVLSTELTEEGLAEVLENQMKKTEGAGALSFNWKQVASLLLSLVQEWLKQ